MKQKRQRLAPQIVSSTEDRKQAIIREIRALDKAAIERGEMKERVVPILFLWGKPVKRLCEAETQTYINLGARVNYLSETEVKSLKL